MQLNPQLAQASESPTFVSGAIFNPSVQLDQAVTVALFDNGKRQAHRRFLSFICWLGDTVLFNGDDYSPSPQRSPSSKAALLDLMNFLTTQPGDTDEEYFERYTPEQIQFAQSALCEQLTYQLYSEEEEYRPRTYKTGILFINQFTFHYDNATA